MFEYFKDNIRLIKEMKSEEKKILEIFINLLLESKKTEINSSKNNYKNNYPYPYNISVINRKDKFKLFFGLLVIIAWICSFILLLSLLF